MKLPRLDHRYSLPFFTFAKSAVFLLFSGGVIFGTFTATYIIMSNFQKGGDVEPRFGDCVGRHCGPEQMCSTLGEPRRMFIARDIKN